MCPNSEIRSNTRIVWIDLLKLFAIFQVCMGHCIQGMLEGEPRYEFMYRFIYSFHMPLFMAIVGFFAESGISDFIEYQKKKFRQLILPSLSFTIIGLTVGFGTQNILSSFFNSFWFLKSAFVCCLLYSVCYLFSRTSRFFLVSNHIFFSCQPTYHLL